MDAAMSMTRLAHKGPLMLGISFDTAIAALIALLEASARCFLYVIALSKVTPMLLKMPSYRVTAI